MYFTENKHTFVIGETAVQPKKIAYMANTKVWQNNTLNLRRTAQ